MNRKNDATSSVVGSKSTLNWHGTMNINITSTILSNNLGGRDIEELFMNSARDGAYDRLLKLLSQNTGIPYLSVNLKDKRTGNTALIWACKRGHIKIVQLLLSYEADITIKNYNGESALEVASPAIKQIILDHADHGGASYTQRLLQGAWLGNHNVVNSILSNSEIVDLESVNHDGLTPLLLCTRDIYILEKIAPQLLKRYEPTAVVNDLIQCGANTLARDTEGKTALHYCAGSKASIALPLSALLAQNATIDIPDKRNLTPLHYACQAANTDIVEVLLSYGSDVNGPGFAGTTPLHIAALNNQEHLARLLLQSGADANAVDDSGHTPIDVARFKKFRTMLRTWRRTSGEMRGSSKRTGGSSRTNMSAHHVTLLSDSRIHNILNPIENTTPVRSIRRERTRLLGEPRALGSMSSPDTSLPVVRSTSVNTATNQQEAARVHRIGSAQYSRSQSAVDISALAFQNRSANNAVNLCKKSNRRFSHDSPSPRLAPITDQVSPMPDLLDCSFQSSSRCRSENSLTSRQQTTPITFERKDLKFPAPNVKSDLPTVLKAEFVIGESRLKSHIPPPKPKVPNSSKSSATLQQSIVNPAVKRTAPEITTSSSSKTTSPTKNTRPLPVGKQTTVKKMNKPTQPKTLKSSNQKTVNINKKVTSCRADALNTDDKPHASDAVSDVVAMPTHKFQTHSPPKASTPPHNSSADVNTLHESHRAPSLSIKPTLISPVGTPQLHMNILPSANSDPPSDYLTKSHSNNADSDTAEFSELQKRSTANPLMASNLKEQISPAKKGPDTDNGNNVLATTVTSNLPSISLNTDKTFTITNTSTYSNFIQNSEFLSSTMNIKEIDKTLVEDLLETSNTQSPQCKDTSSAKTMTLSDRTATLRPSFTTHETVRNKSTSNPHRSLYQPLHLLMNRPTRLSQVNEEHALEEETADQSMGPDHTNSTTAITTTTTTTATTTTADADTMKYDKAFTLTISQQERASDYASNEPHNGPIIEDIFENFPRPIYEFATIVAQDIANKKATPKTKKKRLPSNSSSSRGNSAVNGRRVAGKSSSAAKHVAKRKGNTKKGVQVGKKNSVQKENIPHAASNSALISGVNWHIETECDSSIVLDDSTDTKLEDDKVTHSLYQRSGSFVGMSPRQKREELKKMLMLLRKSGANEANHDNAAAFLPQTMQAIHEFMNSVPDEQELDSLFALDTSSQGEPSEGNLLLVSEEAQADDCSEIDLSVSRNSPVDAAKIDQSGFTNDNQSAVVPSSLNGELINEPLKPHEENSERCASTSMSNIIEEILDTPRRDSLPFAFYPQLSISQSSSSDSHSNTSTECATSEYTSDSVSTSSEDSTESQELDGSENQAMNKNISLPTYPASKKSTLSFTEVDHLPVGFALLETKNLSKSLSAVITPDIQGVLAGIPDLPDPPEANESIETGSKDGDTQHLLTWKKGNILGKGAYGTVYCGLTSDGHLIAVKQIELNIHDWEKAEREYDAIQQEVELLRNLNHKNIVGFLGTSLENYVVSIYMQLVHGGTIASLLDKFGMFEERVFQRFTRQIVDGIQYLHSNGVIHRDIKGGNIMLMSNGVIKLIDFGCAKRLYANLSVNQSQVLKSMKGTPYWMAPEVIKETGHGFKSDIWSIGCTVFEMATTKPPWYEMAPMAAVFAIGSDKPIPLLPETCSKEARHFVGLCLNRDQRKRSTAEELLESPFLNTYAPLESENV